MSETLSKAEFLANLEGGRSRLWFFIDGLSTAHFTALQDAKGWTIQDHLLHLAMWEKGMTAVLQHQSRWEAMDLDYRGVVLKTNEFDELNEILRAQYANKSAQETVDTLKTVQAGFDEAVAATNEADLQQLFTFFHPDKPTNDVGAPIIERLASNSYEHYDMHLEWMGKLLPVPSKAEFLERLIPWREQLWAFIDGLSEEQFTAKRDAGGWSIKDHLSHLAIWEKGMTALLHHESRPEAMGLTIELWDSSADYDAFNDVIFKQHRDEAAAEVLATLKAEQAAFDAAFAPLGDEDLAKPYKHYQPEETDGDNPIFWNLSGNTFGHYEEHLPWMQALV